MPGGLGEVEVVRQRAHPLAEQRHPQHQAGGDDHDHPDHDRDQLRAADREAEELDGRGVVDVER